MPSPRLRHGLVVRGIFVLVGIHSHHTEGVLSATSRRTGEGPEMVGDGLRKYDFEMMMVGNMMVYEFDNHNITGYMNDDL